MSHRPIPALVVIALAALVPGQCKASDPTNCAFTNKLIFSETPEIGQKWHGGLRTQLAAAFIQIQADTGVQRATIPSLVLDAYWNCADWLSVDLFFAGIPQVKSAKDTVTHDTTTIADNFSILTLKSRPYRLTAGPVEYKVGGGIKWYGARATFTNSAKPENDYINHDNSISLFVTESARIFGFNYVNLYTSMALRDHKLDLKTAVYPSFTVVPGYRIFIGRRQWFSLGVEYYLMNPVQFPMKSVQVLGSVNQLQIENYDQEYYGFLFYGFQFAAKHLWAGLTMGNYYTFAGPKLLVFGIGYKI